MMCLKHNKWYRFGERCQLCDNELKERLDRAIFEAEKIGKNKRKL